MAQRCYGIYGQTYLDGDLEDTVAKTIECEIAAWRGEVQG